MNETNNKCTLPPKGWKCTRKVGHDGPCAAVSQNDLTQEIRKLIVNSWIHLGELCAFLGDATDNLTNIDWEEENIDKTICYKIAMFFYDGYQNCLKHSLYLNDKWNLEIWSKPKEPKE